MTTQPSLDEFRAAARSWLKANAEPLDLGEEGWGVGSDSVAVFHDRDAAGEAQAIASAKSWHRTKKASGWTALSWPAELGGRGLPATYERAFASEEGLFAVPPVPEAITITLSLVAPTLNALAAPDLRDRFIRPFLSLDLLCCQLFSEPNAGSDLAGVACKAERVDPSTWLLNGQKVWTSGARECDYGLLIARSDSSAAKHHGMTAFLLPLDAPGVEIRPIRQMTGGASFNEVFLGDVEVSDDLRVGEEGEGWKVALTMLGFERSISGDGAGGAGGSWAQVLALARHVDAAASPLARQTLARLFERSRILDLMNERTRGALAAGQDPGVIGSIAKLYWVQTMTLMSDVVSELLGPRLVADTGAWGMYAWTEHLLGAPGYRIAGGSDEIQRNIIGEKVLGLPREPR